MISMAVGMFLYNVYLILRMWIFSNRMYCRGVFFHLHFRSILLHRSGLPMFLHHHPIELLTFLKVTRMMVGI